MYYCCCCGGVLWCVVVCCCVLWCVVVCCGVLWCWCCCCCHLVVCDQFSFSPCMCVTVLLSMHDVSRMHVFVFVRSLLTDVTATQHLHLHAEAVGKK